MVVYEFNKSIFEFNILKIAMEKPLFGRDELTALILAVLQSLLGLFFA